MNRSSVRKLFAMAAGLGLLASPALAGDRAPAGVSGVTDIVHRSYVGSGAEVLIAGFIVEGSGSIRVVIVGRGPSLEGEGVAGFLPDPTISLLRGQSVVAQNDDFGSSADLDEILASGFAPSSPSEAAIVADLAPGTYNLFIQGFGAIREGVGAAAIHALSGSGAEIVNMSVRSAASDTASLPLQRVTLAGEGSGYLFFRAYGPTLGVPPFNVPGFMDDPNLLVRRDGNIVAENSSWRDDPNAATIQLLGLAPPDDLEPAVLIGAPAAGEYEALFGGDDNSRGIVVAEFYTSSEPLPVLPVLPSAPTGLVAVGGPNNIRLSWDPNPEPDLIGYNVYRSTSANGTYAGPLNAQPLARTSYTDAGAQLSPSATYHYRVAAVGPDGTGPRGDSASGRVGTAFLSLGAANAPAGGTVSVPINFANAAGLSGLVANIDVAYDSAVLTVTGVAPAPAGAGFQFSLGPRPPQGGKSVVRVRATSSGTGAGGGTFAYLQLRIDGPQGTVSDLELVGAELRTESYGGTALTTEFGPPAAVAARAEYGRGDATGDGVADDADVARALRLATGAVSPNGPDEIAASDLNGDGTIDAGDATLVARAASGLSTTPLANPLSGESLAVRAETADATCAGSSLEIPIVVRPAARLAGVTVELIYDTTRLRFEGVSNRLADRGFRTDAQASGGIARVVAAGPEEVVPADGIVAAARFARVAGSEAPYDVGIGRSRLSGLAGEDLAARNSVANVSGRIDPDDFCAVPPRLANISTRGFVGTGSNVMIAGIIVGGTEPRRVLVSGVGPDLAGAGIATPLANPSLGLFMGQTVLATNDDWMQAANASEIMATGRAPNRPSEAAILIDLPPGQYTAFLSGSAGETGVGLVQAFDVGSGDGRFVNISTRLAVGTGDNVMIGGFILDGARQRVLVRGLGPTLGNPPFDVPGAMADPDLILLSGQDIVQSNENWEAHPDAATIQSIGLSPPDPREPAILVDLDPGAYTALLFGANGTEGVALIEVYEAP